MNRMTRSCPLQVFMLCLGVTGDAASERDEVTHRLEKQRDLAEPHGSANPFRD